VKGYLLHKQRKSLEWHSRGVREYMKRGLLDIGEVLPSVSGTKTLRYFIYRDKLNKYLGKEVT